MKAEEKPRRKGGRSLGIRSNTPSSRAMYGAIPAVASTVSVRLHRVVSSTRGVKCHTPSSSAKGG